MAHFDILEEQHHNQQWQGQAERADSQDLLGLPIAEVDGIPRRGSHLVLLCSDERAEHDWNDILLIFWKVLPETSRQEGIPKGSTDAVITYLALEAPGWGSLRGVVGGWEGTL